jgi:cysteine dioxygenase
MPQQLAAEQLAVGEWIERLAAIPERDFTLKNIHSFVLRHHIKPQTLDKYLFYSKGCYTRNLIYKNGIFECMAICWEIGQFSRIHNHRGQHCWMSTPIGRLRVQNFHVDERNTAHGTCRIAPTSVVDMDPTHPAYVDPAEPVHQVLNLPEFGRRAVSVHIYSKPFDMCEVYQRESGAYSDVPLHYTSEYGKLSSGEMLV